MNNHVNLQFTRMPGTAPFTTSVNVQTSNDQPFAVLHELANSMPLVEQQLERAQRGDYGQTTYQIRR